MAAGSTRIYVWRMYYDTEGGERHSCDSIRVSDREPPIDSERTLSDLGELAHRWPIGHKVRVYPLHERLTEVHQVKMRKGTGTYPRRVEVLRQIPIYGDFDPVVGDDAPLAGGYYDSDDVPAP